LMVHIGTMGAPSASACSGSQHQQKRNREPRHTQEGHSVVSYCSVEVCSMEPARSASIVASVMHLSFAAVFMQALMFSHDQTAAVAVSATVSAVLAA
jgi:hypothetical protein